jgi:AbrB family looped-hinge helix DNA binding protein
MIKVDNTKNSKDMKNVETRNKAVENQDEECSCKEASDASCCDVEAIVSVDERGQMVLPKELRKKANIKSGDKLALMTWKKKDQINLIYLMKTSNIAEKIGDLINQPS